MTNLLRILPWLTIVGLREDGWEGLNAAAKQAITSANLLYGGSRHLAHIPATVDEPQRIAWPSPMALALSEILAKHRHQSRVTVLASGDPMLYGVGVTLLRDLHPDEFRVIPQVSSFALACARLGWPAAETTLISLVSRPFEQIFRYLVPGQRLILFSEDGSTPATVARMFTERGYGASVLHVFEHLGGSAEAHRSGVASSWPAERSSDLNLIALLCHADADAQCLPFAPGLPDDAFATDGQFTKREVRAATLSQLAPLPGQLLWDVGAGNGTIGIEWMRVHPSCSCVAFEQREDRAASIRTNAKNLGVPALKVIQGSAPEAFPDLSSPNTIFIGGGLGTAGLFEECWRRLLEGGRLVANAVTLESEALLAALHRQYGGELSRIQVARAELIGGVYAWRQHMPITQWAVMKRRVTKS